MNPYGFCNGYCGGALPYPLCYWGLTASSLGIVPHFRELPCPGLHPFPEDTIQLVTCWSGRETPQSQPGLEQLRKAMPAPEILVVWAEASLAIALQLFSLPSPASLTGLWVCLPEHFPISHLSVYLMRYFHTTQEKKTSKPFCLQHFMGSTN